MNKKIINENDKANAFLNVVLLFILIFYLNDLIKPVSLKESFAIPLTIFSGIGGIIGLLLFYHRNKVMQRQVETQYQIFLGSREFDNFLEATKLLTNKDSTIESKISAIYLLYDIAKNHSENLDRVIQILNKQLIPLIKCLEDDCNNKKITKKIDYHLQKLGQKNIKKVNYIYNDTINIDYKDVSIKRTIKEWQFNGNEIEKLVSVALKVLKNIVIEIVLKQDKHIDISNAILFDINSDFDKNLKFKSIQKPTEYLSFLNCKLNNVFFKNTIYYYAHFIHCDLKNSDFSNANLWGSEFINCNLEGVKFKNTECEGVIFDNCQNFTIEQIETMKFEIKEKLKDTSLSTELLKDLQEENLITISYDIKFDDFYPIFIEQSEKIDSIACFKNKDDYLKFLIIKQKILNKLNKNAKETINDKNS